MGSLITVITEVDSLSIKDQQVVVKEGSIEKWIAESKYNSKTVAKQSYEEVVQHISGSQSGETLGMVI